MQTALTAWMTRRSNWQDSVKDIIEVTCADGTKIIMSERTYRKWIAKISEHELKHHTAKYIKI